MMISKSEIEVARKPWQYLLIGCFKGRQRDARFMAEALSQQWHTKGDVEIISIVAGYFTFRFSCEEDMLRAWTSGPWSVGSMVLSLEE